ncbi:hypothetical protein [Burkholderia cenocepacia]|uniref:hypothetical protein n=1 Tax=Burkholderia cenocepacia TaxID=95486 RepID=UPI001BA29E62|nr:hypothetical protein [Burkholderia cenocepacia]MBR8509620.1 hypothetical protein [Burkholderia cenocepacia]
MTTNKSHTDALTAPAALAAIETFEIVGENNDSREPNDEDRFILTEFIAHAFGGYPVEQHEAAPAGADNFACYLIDKCERETITEENVQAWLGAMLRDPQYAKTQPEPQAADERAATPAAKWRIDGEPDPHADRYDVERAALTLGMLTDDELANGAFMNYDRPMDIARSLSRDPDYHSPIVWMTAVKDRIRWLSRALEKACAHSANETGAEEASQTLLRQEAEVGQRLMNACTDAGCPSGVNMVDWIRELAARAPRTDVAGGVQPSIEYRYEGGTFWCDLGPAERMRPDFKGVYRLKAGEFPVWGGDEPSADAAAEPADGTPSRDRLLAALERATKAECALRALVDECGNDTTAGWEDRMQILIDDANRLLAGTAPADAQAVEAVAVAVALPQPVLDALRFYANGHHYTIDDDHQQFDTVSGEPQNWLCSERDDDCTMIEDGSIAKAALQGRPLGFEEAVPAVEGETYAAPPSPAPASAPVGLTDEQRVFTYRHQPNNVGAWRLGEACRAAKPGGDPIDHGLSLLKELQAKGFGVVALLEGAKQ